MQNVLKFSFSDEEFASSHAAMDKFRLSVEAVEDKQQNLDQTDLRTYKLKMLMRSKFEENDALSFNQFTAGVKTRKAMGSTFYHMLLLASSGQIVVEQKESYGDFLMTKTNLF